MCVYEREREIFQVHKWEGIETCNSYCPVSECLESDTVPSKLLIRMAMVIATDSTDLEELPSQVTK